MQLDGMSSSGAWVLHVCCVCTCVRVCGGGVGDLGVLAPRTHATRCISLNVVWQ
jgi:hypothetical protein